MTQPDNNSNSTQPEPSDSASAQPRSTQPESSAKPSVKYSTYYSNNWALGLAVVVIGGLLLARNLGIDIFFLHFHNWWAVFILLAAISPLQQAFSSYQKDGFGAPVLNALASAGAIVFIALIFLLNLSFHTWWPAFVIFWGVYLMTSRNRA